MTYFTNEKTDLDDLQLKLSKLAEICGGDTAAARELGVEYTSYYRWRTGKVRPTKSHMKLINLLVERTATTACKCRGRKCSSGNNDASQAPTHGKAAADP